MKKRPSNSPLTTDGSLNLNPSTKRPTMDPQILAIVLLLAGISLIFAELFLPSGGVIALMCVACFGGSIYFAYDAWRVSYPMYWWGYLATVAFLIPASIFGAFYLLTSTSLGNRVLLSGPSPEEVTPYQAETKHLQSLIGERGVALNLMTPSGLVRVKGERLHAIGEGLMIEANTEIIITEIRGTRVIVRPVDEQDTETSTAFTDPEQTEDPWSDNSEA